MKPEGHEAIYRVAFESASSELTEISTEFNRLRARKDQIEKLLNVLKPLITDEEDESANVSAVTDKPVEQSDTAAESSTETDVQSEPLVADPFQRRIDHVLGIGAGIRDVRKYSRQF